MPSDGTLSMLLEAIAKEVSNLVGQENEKMKNSIVEEITKMRRSIVEEIATAATQPALLTVKQAAAYIARSEQAVQHMISNKHLIVVRDGRRVFLRRTDLDEWIEKKTC